MLVIFRNMSLMRCVLCEKLLYLDILPTAAIKSFILGFRMHQFIIFIIYLQSSLFYVMTIYGSRCREYVLLNKLTTGLTLALS